MWRVWFNVYLRAFQKLALARRRYRSREWLTEGGSMMKKKSMLPPLVNEGKQEITHEEIT
jgi:hypothetical protein